MQVEGFGELTVASLKASGARPAWFGLGFVQLKLDDARRLHFWHPDLPGAGSFEDELHDHRYGFVSRVLAGDVRHEAWSFHPSDDGPYELVEVSCKPGAPDESRHLARGSVRSDGAYRMAAGSTYEFPDHGLHRFVATRAVTLLERGPVVRELARVARPVGSEAACPFAVELPEEMLWGVIADLLGEPARPGYHLREIPKGVMGKASKVVEEAAEFEDAVEQGVSVMALVELSDLVGSVEAWLAANHPSLGLDDLAEMARVTKRAFANGRR